MEERAKHDETNSEFGVVLYDDIVNAQHEVSLVPVQFSCIEEKSEKIQEITTLGPVESNEITDDSKFESLFMKTESEENIQTVKQEKEDDVKSTNSSEIKEESIETREEFLSLSLEFPYLNCKSEVAEQFTVTKYAPIIKPGSTNPVETKAAGGTYSAEQSQIINTWNSPSSTLPQTVLLNSKGCNRESSMQTDLGCINDHNIIDSHIKDKSLSKEELLIKLINCHTGNDFDGDLEFSKKNCSKSYSCSECGKSFKRKDTLIRHLSIHTDYKPFSCSVCSKSFTYKSILNSHMSTHRNKKQFICSVCGKLFNHKSNISEHVSIHTGNKPFCCSVCSKSFTQRSTLNSHMRIHTDKKPFSCNVCGKSFKYKCNLTQHISIHVGSKTFSCSVCSKLFTHKSSLNRHLSLHDEKKPFSCNVCGKSFTKESYLTVHMSNHTGPKPFSCSVCGKSFNRKHNLSRHSSIHNGDKSSRVKFLT